MQGSVFTKYFSLCITVILVSVVCIGTALVMAASQFYTSEKKQALLASANEVISATRLSFTVKNGLDANELTSVYKANAVVSGAEFSLVDGQGQALVCSVPPPCVHTDGTVPLSVMSELKQRQSYFSTGTMDGFYDTSRFTLGLTFQLDQTAYYLFASSSAKSLNNFLLELIRTCFTAIVIVILFSFVLVYLAVRQLTKPLLEMTAAAERFGREDFSQKLEIVEDNEIGRLAASLNEMAASLASVEETRKAFVANVSHELKTPMTSIGGFVDGILDGTIPRSEERKYLTIVSSEVSRLARLVRSMLNITKYETGEFEMKRTPFDITALTIKTVLLFETAIEKKKIDIQGLDSEICYALADMDLIQQIIYNLVENAVKFVNQGGIIQFQFWVEDDSVFVSIQNSGDGIAQADIPKIFDRFYKTDESHGKDKTGMGLGLSIVRSIINLHGGQISVRSVEGEYTAFTFSIPATTEEVFRAYQKNANADHETST